MLYIFLSIFMGLAVGILLRNKVAIRRHIARTLQPAVLLLLLVLGMNLGGESSIWKHLRVLGWSAAILAIFSVAGSILAASLYQLLPGRKESR